MDVIFQFFIKNMIKISIKSTKILSLISTYTKHWNLLPRPVHPHISTTILKNLNLKNQRNSNHAGKMETYFFISTWKMENDWKVKRTHNSVIHPSISIVFVPRFIYLSYTYKYKAHHHHHFYPFTHFSFTIIKYYIS